VTDQRYVVDILLQKYVPSGTRWHNESQKEAGVIIWRAAPIPYATDKAN